MSAVRRAAARRPRRTRAGGRTNGVGGDGRPGAGRGASGSGTRAMRERALELLKELSEADGIPGHEAEVRTIFRRRLARVGSLRQDRLGSVICELPGTGDHPRVMLDSHMDEVGFMVQSVTPRGFIRFLPVGGWWGHVLLAQRVRIQTPAGKVPGVVGSKPPHFLEGDERRRVQEPHEMFIDVGAKNRDDATNAMGIKPGAAIAPATRFETLRDPNLITGKAFDNRAGCALVIQSLLELAARPTPPPCTVLGVGSVQEEVGLRGAVTSTAVADPDLAIVIEGSPGDDTPGSDADSAQAALGCGVQVRVMDNSMLAHRGFLAMIEETAAAARVPYQLAVRRSGGTDGGSIHKHGQGVPTVALAVPVRYIHSHVAVMNVEDYLATLRLILAFVSRCDRKMWDRIS